MCSAMMLHYHSLEHQKELGPRPDLETEKLAEDKKHLEPLVCGQVSLLLRALLSLKEKQMCALKSTHALQGTRVA